MEKTSGYDYSKDFLEYTKKYSLESIEELDFFEGLHKELEEEIDKNKDKIKEIFEH